MDMSFVVLPSLVASLGYALLMPQANLYRTPCGAGTYKDQASDFTPCISCPAGEAGCLASCLSGRLAGWLVC